MKQKKVAEKAVAHRLKAVKAEANPSSKVGRPKKSDEVAYLKARLQEVMLQSALRYIALQQVNKGVLRLNKKIDRLRKEADNKQAMYSQIDSFARRVLGAAARGEFNGIDKMRVTGPGAQEFANDMIRRAINDTKQQLAGV